MTPPSRAALALLLCLGVVALPQGLLEVRFAPGQARELAADEAQSDPGGAYGNVTLGDCFDYGKNNCDQDCACGWCGGELCMPGDASGPTAASEPCSSWQYECDLTPPHSALQIFFIGLVVLLAAACFVVAVGYWVYFRQRRKHIHYLIQNSHCTPETYGSLHDTLYGSQEVAMANAAEEPAP